MTGTRRKDYTGVVRNGIELISPSHQDARQNWMWNCRCHCGRMFTTRATAVAKGTQKGCGCIAKSMRHGMLGTPEYNAWSAMKDRCSNANSPVFHRYGGRGISLCERWNDFKLFLEDMGARPTADHELDRIDNDGNYCQKNCRWATRIQQMRNISKNRMLTKGGVTRCLSEWAEIIGVSHQCIRVRLSRGMSEEEALTKELMSQHKYTCTECGVDFSASVRRRTANAFCSRHCKDAHKNRMYRRS